jgi:P2 family phage contractile tail tube protein
MSLPAANKIPDKLINAKIYKEGKTELMGTADAELPSLEYITEAITGLGLAGEIETPVIGHFKSMPFKFKWNSINETATSLLAAETHSLDVHASVQVYEAGTGKLTSKPVKVLLRGLPKKVGLGKLEPAKKMDPETELECVYIKMWIDGVVVLEIDKFNFICNINGDDALAQVRRDLGME